MMYQIPLIDRISLDEKTGCWNWIGACHSRGYGTVGYMGKTMRAHRLSAHIWLKMPLNDKRNVLHRCDNPRCFNPKHLFIGTQKDNVQDSIKKKRPHPGYINSMKTKCPQGHPYSKENTYFFDAKHGRACKICVFERNKKYARKMAII